MRLAVATSVDLPALDGDGPALLGALRQVGIAADIVAWSDAEVAWNDYDAVLIRSTWDYIEQPQAFLRWIDTCPSTVNDRRIVRWNIDKSYLLDLRAAGVPTIPTQLVLPGQQLNLPTGWVGELVVKPTVGANAFRTGRFAADDPRMAELVNTIHRSGIDVMCQPYWSSVASRGETSLIYVAGRFSHAITKSALLTTLGLAKPRSLADLAGAISPTIPSETQMRIADHALDVVRAKTNLLPCYARVDLVWSSQDAPTVIELELIEPSLFFRCAPGTAVLAFAEAVRDAVSGHL